MSTIQRLSRPPTLIVDQAGVVITEGDVILHGEMYWEVTAIGGELRLVLDHGTEALQPYWCCCGTIVGRNGFIEKS